MTTEILQSDMAYSEDHVRTVCCKGLL